MNGLPAWLVAGSVDALAGACCDVTVANISGTVLLNIINDLMRITRPGGQLILTGFPEAEGRSFEEIFPAAETLTAGQWQCVIAKL